MTDFENWMVSVYQGHRAFKNLEQAFRSAWDAGAAAEREKNIRAVRTVQAAYDKITDGGPSIEGSVCSDCIGAIYTGEINVKA